MPRIPPLEHDKMSPEMQSAAEAHAAHVGRMTNMKRTLAHAPAAFHAFMQWYPLCDTVRPFLGERLTNLFAHAISSESDCLVCSTFFRRILRDAGENPDALQLNEREEVVVRFGRQLATNPNQVSDELFARLSQTFAEDELVAPTAFGAMMLATNVFNNALQVDLDEYLTPYRKAEST